MLISVVTPSHDPKYLPELWRSLRRQTYGNWEWIIAPSEVAVDAAVRSGKNPWLDGDMCRVTADARVKVHLYPGPLGNVGAAKMWAFAHAQGDVVVEVDHDDLLSPAALSCIVKEFEEDPEVGFVYSECVDWSPTGELVTYHDPARRAAWEAEGWKFGTASVPWPFTKPTHAETVTYPVSFEPGALMVSTIFRAPNHFRAWRRSVYREIGGHDPSLKVCDDAELMIRTYLATKMKKIPIPLYAYRVDGSNTWLRNVDDIRQKSFELQGANLHKLVAREMQLRGLPCLDMGGGMNFAGPPWIPCDERFAFDEPDDKKEMLVNRCDFERELEKGFVRVDLSQRPWPFDDSSIGAIRAFDFLEHIFNKLDTMREIYRVLAPGGWLLSLTPSAAGPGAYRDPTHLSYHVADGFKYYTERDLGRFLPPAWDGKENPRFMAIRLHESGDPLPYITADLVSLKDDDGSLPGPRRI